jgi:ABC-type Mn2+/Zn2+ transport system ATPase subunit
MSPQPGELLQLRDIVVGYRKGSPLLPPIRFTVRSGDLVGILGPNGAGKSTMLKTLLGLIAPLGGELGYPLGRPPRIGYVPQGARPDFAYPLSAFEVALMGRYGQIGIGQRPKQRDRDLALEQLKAVGLEAQAQQPFRSLSGGQRQRVLVARALAAEPELLVLDEPTSEMDPAAEHALLSLVQSLTRSRQVAVLFVTHEISAAAGFARQVMLLDSLQTFFESGPVEELVTSEHMSKLYGLPVEVRREGGRALVWLSGEATSP